MVSTLTLKDCYAHASGGWWALFVDSTGQEFEVITPTDPRVKPAAWEAQ